MDNKLEDTLNSSHSLERLLKNKRQIDSILQFWFGQYAPEQSQKQLWMISSSSSVLLQQLDEKITQDFTLILIQIFNNSENQRDLWCSQVEWFTWHGKLACIILLDQMSRHIHRYRCTQQQQQQEQEDYHSSYPILPEQTLLDQMAYSIARRFQLDHKQEITCGMIPIPMLIFSLMPYRHASTIQDVGYVLQQIEFLATLHQQDMEHMIRRFRKASNRRMATLQDEARRHGVSPLYTTSDATTEIDIHIIANQKDPTVQEETLDRVYTDEDILETLPFQADFSTARDHLVVKTMIQFLANRGIHPQSNNIKKEDSIITPILISLSGGVDSMVIASTLVYLRDYDLYKHLYIVAIHIDYGNRPESTAEANYVYQYSINTLHLDACIVKKVDEFKRGVTDRDEYEKATRNIRYDLYKATIHQCMNHPRCTVTTAQQIGVMLGHHQGDIRENVLSNAHKGCGPLDLSGMTCVGINDGVLIYRPFLTLEKVSIFEYAHKYGIPYFKDTTPHWSTRGKLRNKLLP